MNVSSLLVKVAPANMDAALATLSGSGLCEVHFHDREKGSVVVTIEGRDTGEEMEKLRAIEKLPHVLGAALVYAYSEAELDEAVKKIAEKRGKPVPDELKNA
jgi:nitrate reductase NapD